MTLAGTKCTIPAQKVELLDKDGLVWNVTCDEGPYSLLMAYGNTVVTEGYATYQDKTEGGDAPAAK
jgi:hypothetical protein